MYIKRLTDLESSIKKKSILFIGPRQTGKSSIIRHSFNQYKKYNLLEADTFLKLQRDPTRIRNELKSTDKIIIIDEVQKIPSLLDEIHLLIEEHNVKFLLTGSSLRRFHAHGINRLGGRLRTKRLNPFSKIELKDVKFDLIERLKFGLIPSIYFSDDPQTDLKSYVNDYVQGEVISEGAIRNIPAFARFLEVAALTSGEMINYTNIGNDAQVPRTTIIDYFSVLQQTLLGETLPAWKEGKKRKPITSSKFYFFDTGVINTILNRKEVNRNSRDFGNLFETYIFHELRCYRDYKKDILINYWRSTSQIEVDFVIDGEVAIEVKSTSNVSSEDLKGLKAISEENKFKKLILVCFEKNERVIISDRHEIEIFPWDAFLEKLWDDEII